MADEQELNPLPPQSPSERHAGHRRRMQESFLERGIDGFSDYQVLEFLLSFCIARQDTNPLAHELIRQFGSLHQVFEAPVEQLLRVPGIGARSAALIRLFAELPRRAEQSRYKGAIYLRNKREITNYLRAQVITDWRERGYLLCLDGRCRVLSCPELCEGSVNAVNLPIRKLVEAAVLANATSAILAHTHTNGSILPSREDLEYTREAGRALAMVDVTLVDHFILTQGGCISMAASGYYDFKR